MKPKRCTCDICTKWAPLHRRILAKLRGKDRVLFEEFLDMEEQQSTDLGVATAKLDGTWPGWEWLPKVIRRHQLGFPPE